MRTRAWFLIAFFMVILPIMTQSCSRGSVEDELRSIIYEAKDAASAKDVKGIMKHISDDYRDDEGNNRDAIKGILFYQFMRSQKLSVFIRSVDIQANGADAIADVKAILVSGREISEIKDVLPDEAAGYLFTIVFKKEAGSWKVRSSSWRDIGATGLL